MRKVERRVREAKDKKRERHTALSDERKRGDRGKQSEKGREVS